MYLASTDEQMDMAMSPSERLSKRQLLIWATLVPLAICLVYSLFYLASSLGYSLFIFSNRSVIGQTTILSPSLDVGVWGVAIFAVLARLGYHLELNVVKGYFQSIAGISLIVAICGMAIGVVAVIVGFIGTLALVLISLVLLSMCILFSFDFFEVKRQYFVLRLLVSAVVVFLLVELAGFLL